MPKCKLCPQRFTGEAAYELLVQHWEEDHQKELGRIQRWLADTDEKLARALVPAKEGMKGLK